MAQHWERLVSADPDTVVVPSMALPCLKPSMNRFLDDTSLLKSLHPGEMDIVLTFGEAWFHKFEDDCWYLDGPSDKNCH